MGSGSWDAVSFCSYTTSAKGMSVDDRGSIVGNYSAQEYFKENKLNSMLDPKNVIRECCDSEEHPNTKPVILALDVTGSMGETAVEVAKQLNVVMTRLYEELEDIQFMIMGIGDLAYDYAPIQASQFESDIRIAEQLDKIYFEFGGGGNAYESYTAAWYFGSRHCKLDCWERGQKGIIITLGDEQLNPYLPATPLTICTGDNLQGDIDTKDLYKEVSEKYDIFHIQVNHRYFKDPHISTSWSAILEDGHYREAEINGVVDEICDIIISGYQDKKENVEQTEGLAEISW